MNLINIIKVLAQNRRGIQKPLLSATDINIVFDGNSLTKGTYLNPSGVDQQYPNTVKDWLDTYAKSVTFHSYGVDAQSLTTMIANAATNIDPNIDAAKTNVLVVWEDANDIILNNKTGQQNLDAMTTYVNARWAAGWDYVIVIGGYYPRTPYITATEDDLNRQHDYFELLSASVLGTIRIDLRDNATIGGARGLAQNATYFADYLHLYNAGYDILANEVINNGILKIFR